MGRGEPRLWAPARASRSVALLALVAMLVGKADLASRCRLRCWSGQGCAPCASLCLILGFAGRRLVVLLLVVLGAVVLVECCWGRLDASALPVCALDDLC